ncbi:class F sortase [Streptomyces sp. 8N706]|uniref:class F sortase n=1 Tax=Streptomyces sp. 8N706 TaxID=3457416 RepID=UPI003FD2137A
MSRSHQGPRTTSRRPLFIVSGAVLAVTTAVLLVVGLSRQEPAPPETAPAAQAPAVEGGQQGSQASGSGDSSSGSGKGVGTMEASPPERISIPSLKVSSSLVKLGLGKGGAMETPTDPAKAGWYTPGPTPGAKGPAVIAGHVTWNGAQAVFFKLATLKAGDNIEVTRQDGKTAEFTVDKIAQYPKNRFPTLEVYKNVDHAGLRLITCAGDFDKKTHHYADNVVVYASLTGSRG